MLRLDTATTSGWNVLVLAGELDVASQPRLADAVEDVIAAGANHLVIDMAHATLVDSVGLGSLVSALRRLQEAGGDLRLTGIRPNVARVLAITQLDRVFAIEATVEAAIEAVDLTER